MLPLSRSCVAMQNPRAERSRAENLAVSSIGNGQPFKSFFEVAVKHEPFGFQTCFANDLHSLVHVPTGLGKTAMAVVGWLWRRSFGAGDEVRCKTPRRLVYCLPMRVLVEQTRDNAVRWLENLREANLVECEVPVHVLMGGEDEEDWDIHPEREAILIGTQDMLLSRALNRGYAASRARWPMQFGLLHTDCLWVFDEIQLMGSGLATTAQLEAFRRLLPEKDANTAENGHGCRSVWMSATMRPDWLKTVDFKDRVDALPRLELDGVDHKSSEVMKRWSAKKPLEKAAGVMDLKSQGPLADEIVKAHTAAKGRTIVVVNTVKRACYLLTEIKKKWPSATDENLILIHSRFRPPDRAEQIKKLKPEQAPIDLSPEGMIVVSTQVIEAGVDVSATTLFTELAPWASLVQRFGRCNRRGEQNEHASVRWIEVADKDAAPYEAADLKKSREQLEAIGCYGEKERDVGLASLSKLNVELPFEHTHVIRRKDLIDLFDTTPDLAGNDIDIDRFVREVEESDVRVFWRDYGDPKKGTTPNKIGGQDPNDDDSHAEPAPRRKELCPAPIGSDKNPGFQQFAGKHKDRVWRWNFLDRTWEKADTAKIVPGQVFLLHADSGGYSAERGWDPAGKTDVAPIAPPTDDDGLSRAGVWQTIAVHTNEVCNELDTIVNALSLDGDQAEALRAAARWHDWAKAHAVFQNAVDDGQTVQRSRGTVTRRARPNGWIGNRVIAKAPSKRWSNGQFADAGWWRRYDWPDGGRRHFRHELASALAVLQRPHEQLEQLSNDYLNLVAYLIAAHHGKVRLSIRSLPNEMRPRDRDGKHLNGCRFARGVWDDDALPSVDLGGGITAPAVTLSLEPMELGLCEQPPFAGQPSWAERMIGLRDSLGPFRLGYLEAILRAADMRASKAAEQRAAPDHQRADAGRSVNSKRAVQ